MKNLILVGVAVLVGACNRPEEPSTTHGKLFMLVTESQVLLMTKEADEYMAEYNKTEIHMAGTTTREAIVALLNDSVRCICVDRQLNEEERKVVQQSGMNLATISIARGALVLIVSDNNPLRTIKLATIRSILDKSIALWKNVPGSHLSGRLELILLGKNAGVNELLRRGFFDLPNEIVPTKTGATEQEMVRYIAGNPQALGIVSFAAVVDHPKGIHKLAVQSTDSTSEGEFIEASQSNIYEKLYPLNYSLYLYISETKLGVGSGFSTFVKTLPGQQIIQDYGLAPEIQPSRIIQLKSE
jgi:phosphate transport system substrate-binding protein